MLEVKPQKATFKEVEYEEKKYEKGKIYSRYVNGSRGWKVLEERKQIIDDFIKDNTWFICKRSRFLRSIFYSIRYMDKKVWHGCYDKDIVMIYKRWLTRWKHIGTLVMESTKLQKGVTRIEFAIK